jgi:hypothetical protein
VLLQALGITARHTCRFIDYDDDLPGRQTKYIQAY